MLLKKTLSFLSFQIGFSFAANAMSLQEALNQAHLGTPQTQRAESAATEAQWKTRETYAAFLPTLSAGATYLTDKRYMLTDVTLGGVKTSIPNVVPAAIGSVSANYLLFDGFASTTRLWSAQAFERSAEKEFDWAKFQVERQVELRFYQALAARVLKNVAEQNLKTLEDHLKDANALRKAGISTKYDVLRVEVQVSEARSEVMNATDNMAIAAGKLAEVLGQDSAVEATGSLPILKSDLIKDVDAESFAGRGDLESQRERAQGFNYGDTSNGLYWVPRLSLFGTYQYYNNRTDSPSDWSSYREAYQIGLNMTWNIFDGLTSMSKSRQALEQKVQSEKTLKISQLKARTDLDLWKRKFAYYCNVYQSRLGDIAKSQESVRLASEGRRVGARTTTDLLDAESELNRAQASAVTSLIGAIEALVNVELSTGRSLYQFN